MIHFDWSFEHKLPYWEALARMKSIFRELQADIPALAGILQEGWTERGGFLRLSGEKIKLTAVVSLPGPGKLEVFLAIFFKGANIFGKPLEMMLRPAIEEQLSY